MGYKKTASGIFMANVISRYEINIKKKTTDARKHLLFVSNNCMEWAARQVSH